MTKKVKSIIDDLTLEYPDAACELNHESPFQLLIATVLSAQTTDKKVNEITAVMFKEHPDLQSFLEMTQGEIENYIKKLGLYRNKAKNIYQLCRQLQEEFGGEVPKEMKELISLAGVGRKTANVVMSNAFGYPAIAVDTHVFRVSNRIGLAKAKNVSETEKQLMKAIKKDLWTFTHHLLIFHGRRCCTARKPNCEVCILKDRCNFYKLESKKK